MYIILLQCNKKDNVIFTKTVTEYMTFQTVTSSMELTAMQRNKDADIV